MQLLQSAAVCCSLLQSVAVCCSLLQSIVVYHSLLHSVAVCCSLLQSIVVYHSLLQSVAVCCSLSQCVHVAARLPYDRCRAGETGERARERETPENRKTEGSGGRQGTETSKRKREEVIVCWESLEECNSKSEVCAII